MWEAIGLRRPRGWVAALAIFSLFILITNCKSLPLEKEDAPHAGVGKSGVASVEGVDEIFLSQADSVPGILSSLQMELERSRRQLQRPNYPAPYFLAYRLRDEGSYRLTAKYGTIVTDDTDRKRIVYSEVRVGDYFFDNRGGKWSYQEYAPVWDDFSLYAPLENVPGAIRRIFWLLSDSAYKGAIESYLQKRAESVQKAEKKKVASFARAEPVRERETLASLRLSREDWKRRLRRLSAILSSSDDLIDSQASFYVMRSDRFFVTSEGSEVADQSVQFSMHVEAFARADDGSPLTNQRVWVAPTESEMPSQDFMESETRALVEELRALRKAEALPPYTGPAILAPDATGVFFHEAVGHRLEGERQEDEHSGQTFRGKIGEEIIPTFLTVYDDPSQEREGPQALSGYYQVDDEGVRSRKVVLVDKGVLKTFLLSRAPVEGFPQSNGHGRADAFRAPMARMGNLVVRSTNELAEEDLLKQLRDLAKKQGLAFGLYIQDVDSGETNTSRYGVQAFRGVPHRVWKVDTETGKKTLVRGVEMIGTPLTSIRKIVATGKDYKVFNGFCGAESGMVPVSAVAPSALISEIETQRATEPPRAGPMIPPPPLPPLSEERAAPPSSGKP